MKLLKISPEKTLVFPANHYPSIEIQLENISQGHVAFKVKTTAPKAYLVKPSTGTIGSGQSQRVQIVVQGAVDTSKPCPDRFLIQAVAVESEHPVQRDFWNTVSKDCLEEQKLAVSFKAPSAQHSSVDDRGFHEGMMASSSSSSSFAPSSGMPSSPSSSSPTSSSFLNSGGDFKKRYDELLYYSMSLERQIKEQNHHVESLRKQLQKTQQPPAKNTLFSLELWHIPLYLLLVVILWYFFFMSNDIPTPDSIQ